MVVIQNFMICIINFSVEISLEANPVLLNGHSHSAFGDIYRHIESQAESPRADGFTIGIF